MGLIMLIIAIIIVVLLISVMMKLGKSKKNNTQLLEANNHLQANLNVLNNEITTKDLFINDLNIRMDKLTATNHELELNNVALSNKNDQYVTQISQLQGQITQLETSMQQQIMQVEEQQKQIELNQKALIKDQQEFNQYVNQEQSKLAKQANDLVLQQQNLKDQEYDLRQQQTELEESVNQRLYQISQLSETEARNLVLDQVRVEKRDEISKELEAFDNQLQLDKREIAEEVLLTAMQNLAGEEVTESFSKIIKIPDETIKGRLIGRDGRNIHLLENLLGVNIIIDDTPGQFMISSFNPVRRAKASRTFERLISSGKINQAEIEDTVDKVEQEFNETILTKGKEMVNMFGITNIHKSLVEKLGCLYYRTSYGQNMYSHSIEVAKIARSIANQLGLDGKLAARCALLHDIGKVDSEELGISHVELGVSYAQRANEPKEVINAIAAHHGDVEPDNIYAIITIIADSISASQIGARSDTYEAFIQRVEALEDIALNVKGVNKAYALKGGKELRIVVSANQVKDSQLKALAHEVKHQIETTLNLPAGVVVNVLRENRYITNAKKMNNKEEDND